MTTCNIKIEKLAALGDGIGHIDGQVCFVPFSAPGDHLSIRITRNNKNFMRGEIIEILEPGIGRIEPLCPLFGQCGGCSWQHLAIDVQKQWKKDILFHELQHDNLDFTWSPHPFEYRCLARLHWRPNIKSGYLGFASFHRKNNIIDVANCPILKPKLSNCIKVLKYELLSLIKSPCEVRLVLDSHGPAAVISLKNDLPQEVYAKAKTLVPNEFSSLQVVIDGIHATIAGKRGEICTLAADGSDFYAPALSFGQANLGINREIAKITKTWISKKGFKTALELFSGSSNLSISLAPYIKKMTVSELDETALTSAKNNLSLRNLSHVSTKSGDSLEVYRNIGKDFEFIILNPPRRGHLELAQSIKLGNHKAVLYISCSPSTLARDITVLKSAGYKITHAHGFDMFPQTAHMEAAVFLER